VPRGRHSLEPTKVRSKVRSRRLALVTAPLVTVLVVGLGVATSGFGRALSPSTASANVGAAAGTSSTHVVPDPSRGLGTSRSNERVPLVDHRVPKAKGKLWATSDLNLRVDPRQKSKVSGLLKSGKQVPVTGVRQDGYAQVIVNGVTWWVTASYLSKNKEVQPGSLGLVDRSCPGTSGVENGLTSSAIRVYRAVCNNFPQITSYGGYAPRGEHASGKAIDIMTSDTALGDRIAAFLQANSGALNLYDIIFQQRIWTPVRASEGWRSMPDRGSPTANHFDHVHVSVN
jgi:hypothetical protein